MDTNDDRVPFTVVKLSVRNRRKRATIFRLEPWGERHVFPSGAVFQVEARGPEGDTLDVEWGPEGVTVFAWPGASVRVLYRGVDVNASLEQPRPERLTAPWLPEGMRTRDWVSAMMTG